MRIGIDVDGVLADFCTGYAKLLRETSGRDLISDEEVKNPASWFWERDAGYTAAEEKAVWDQIMLGGFWYDLPVLPNASVLIEEAENQANELYFITKRVGYKVQRETCAWLNHKAGMKGYPNVIIVASSKKPILNGLDLDYYLDDKFENVIDAHDAGVREVYLLNYKHNQKENFFGLNRIDNVLQFVEAFSNER